MAVILISTEMVVTSIFFSVLVVMAIVAVMNRLAVFAIIAVITAL